jgi:hypothetical protein
MRNTHGSPEKDTEPARPSSRTSVATPRQLFLMPDSPA